MSLSPALSKIEEKPCLELFLNYLEMVDNKELMFVEILHDEIGSDLMACKMQLKQLNIGAHEKSLLENNLKAILLKIRNLSNQVYPSSIENLGLHEAIKMNLRMVQNSTNVQLDLISKQMMFRLSKKEERAIYFILNELISNCLNHSNCSKIEVDLGQTSNSFYCSIKDDGDGFEINENDFFGPCQLGLQKVFGRIKGVNAKIAFKKNDNYGSSVKIELNYAN